MPASPATSSGRKAAETAFIIVYPLIRRTVFRCAMHKFREGNNDAMLPCDLRLKAGLPAKQDKNKTKYVGVKQQITPTMFLENRRHNNEYESGEGFSQQRLAARFQRQRNGGKRYKEGTKRVQKERVISETPAGTGTLAEISSLNFSPYKSCDGKSDHLFHGGLQ